MSRLLLRALSTYVASIHSLGLPLRINGKLMERIKVNLIMRVFVPSITWNLITRVLAFYHVKLPQSTALEQERCDPRSEAGVRSTPWLWVYKLWEWIEIWPPKRLLYKLNLNPKSVAIKSEISWKPLTLSSLASLSCSSIWARDLVRLVTWIS